MSGHRGKLVALAATATMGELFAECKQQAETSPILAEELAELAEVYLLENPKNYLADTLIDIEQLELDKEAKSSLLYKAREQARLPAIPEINKMWTVKPTIRARLPIH